MAKLSDDEIEVLLEELDSQYKELSDQSLFDNIHQELDRIGHQLTDLPLTLTAVRKRGYVHSGQMEGTLKTYRKRWKKIESETRDVITNSVDYLDDYAENAGDDLDKADDTWKNKHLDRAQRSINLFSEEIDKATENIESIYGPVRDALNEISSTLSHAEWMLDQIDQSQEIRLQLAEGPYAAVEAEWERDGKEGPDGIFILTDQRLLFEQKEKVATKKLFGLFTTESESVQELLLDVSIQEIDSVEHGEEGGFLGIGSADILKLVFAASAPLSRARFHLKGQESSDWAIWIKNAKTGMLDRERVKSAQAEREEATSITFPEQCPGCFAAVPPQPHGITAVTCEFCGRTVQPV